jgi:hypothetical protein
MEGVFGYQQPCRQAASSLSLQHRHAVLLADRTRDVRTITTVVKEVLAANPETTSFDIEAALRAALGQAYLVANSHHFWFRDCARYAGLPRRAR